MSGRASPIEKGAIAWILAEWFGCGTKVSCALHKGLCGTAKSVRCRNTNEAQYCDNMFLAHACKILIKCVCN